MTTTTSEFLFFFNENCPKREFWCGWGQNLSACFSLPQLWFLSCPILLLWYNGRCSIDFCGSRSFLLWLLSSRTSFSRRSVKNFSQFPVIFPTCLRFTSSSRLHPHLTLYQVFSWYPLWFLFSFIQFAFWSFNFSSKKGERILSVERFLPSRNFSFNHKKSDIRQDRLNGAETSADVSCFEQQPSEGKVVVTTAWSNQNIIFGIIKFLKKSLTFWKPPLQVLLLLSRMKEKMLPTTDHKNKIPYGSLSRLPSLTTVIFILITSSLSSSYVMSKGKSLTSSFLSKGRHLFGCHRMCSLLFCNVCVFL